VSEVGVSKPVVLPEPPVSHASSSDERSVDEGERIEEHWPDGKPKLSRSVRRDGDGIVNHGPFRKWYPNGVVAEEGRYVEGEKDGLYVMRWDTGFDKSRIEYRRGQQNGRAQKWNEDGVLLYDATYVDGVPEGIEREWWPNQGPRAEASYSKGLPDGPWKKWHGKGAVAEEGSYSQGKRVGTWTYRYAAGTLQLIEQYQDGRLHGHVIEYDEGEHVLSDGEYKEGVADGVHLEFHANGQKKSETHFARGKTGRQGDALVRQRTDGSGRRAADGCTGGQMDLLECGRNDRFEVQRHLRRRAARRWSVIALFAFGAACASSQGSRRVSVSSGQEPDPAAVSRVVAQAPSEATETNEFTDTSEGVAGCH
jgi:antitoxin component YwqK of YwqJK toxin-antitoxin module